MGVPPISPTRTRHLTRHDRFIPKTAIETKSGRDMLCVSFKYCEATSLSARWTCERKSGFAILRGHAQHVPTKRIPAVLLISNRFIRVHSSLKFPANGRDAHATWLSGNASYDPEGQKMVAGDRGTREPPVTQAFDTAPAGAGDRLWLRFHGDGPVLASLPGR